MLTFLFIVFTLLSLLAGVFYSLKFTRDTGFEGFRLSYKTLGASVLSLVFLALAMGNVNVQAGDRGVLKRFGRVVRTLEPGLHFIRPVGDEVVSVPVQSRIVKPNEDAASKDLQIVHFEVTFRYHTDPAYADYILVQYNNDAESRVIDPAILEAIKATSSQFDAQELVGKRPLVRDAIESFVSKTLQGTHIIPETTSITQFNFSKEYEDSIEKKVVAQQKAEQATNDLERIKIEAQQAKATAEGQAFSRVANANGEAQAVLIVAKAKAEGQRLQRENITPELIQIRTIELLHDKWTGDFPNTFFGGGNGLNPVSILIQPPAGTKKKLDTAGSKE